MGKCRATGVKLYKQVLSGNAYIIAQTTVVYVVSPDIISITACPYNRYARNIRFYLSYTSTLQFCLLSHIQQRKGHICSAVDNIK